MHASRKYPKVWVSPPWRNRSPPALPAGPIQRWTTSVTDWKPLLLLAAGGIYAAGYVARAVHAWDSSLGILPVLDFQYFVAGVFLLVPLGALGLVFIVLRWALRRWVAWERLQENRQQRTDQVFAAIIGGGVFLTYLAKNGWLGVRTEPIAAALPIAIVGAMFILIGLFVVRDPVVTQAVPVEADVSPKRSRVGAWVIMLFGSLGLFLSWLVSMTILLVIALFAIVVPLYGVLALPHWPQELGGAKPRCLVLDVEVKRLSPQLAADLFDDSSPPIASEVRRTRELAVHFSNSEFMTIRLPASPQIRRRTLELKRAAVVATMSCSERIGQST